jgi:hypothetical protein
MHGRETWILTKKSPQNIESAELKFLRVVKRYTGLDKISNHYYFGSELGASEVTENTNK